MISASSFKIREASAADVHALAALHVETFHETHGKNPGSPTIELRESQWKQLFQNKDESWFCFVIEGENKKLVGFAKGQHHTHSPDFSGELNKIYLLRKYHHKGLGRQLIGRVAREFINRGISSMLLFGDAKNPTNGFYEAMGGEKLFSDKGEFHGSYGWRDLQKLI
ncbi:hypothetical protein WSM22_22750 [Cytophagales bacterium WSM2-2]|nr:hypothetical protein WSM22_22750 [Cytophagales bacterium WSM2-2]